MYVARIAASALGVSLAFLSAQARADEPPRSAAPAAVDHDPGRLRIGFNFLNAGYGTGGGIHGVTFGATLKVGYQLNHWVGVYGNVSPLVFVGGGGSNDASGTSVSVGAIAGIQGTPLFSFTPIDLLEIAAGPSADYLGGGHESVTANGLAGSASVSTGGFGGVYFGLHGKVALHLGGHNHETGRRRGFTIEANVHPSFVPGGPLTFFTGGLGYDWY